jgi:hypothetical protein
MNAQIKDGNLVITIPVAPRPSKTGKTVLVAGTSGFVQSTAQHDGKQISISVNATVPR